MRFGSRFRLGRPWRGVDSTRRDEVVLRRLRMRCESQILNRIVVGC